MVRGRPIKSAVRQNIVEILYFMKKGYGYDIHKVYIKLFPRVSQRLIYYHLKKGVLTGEIKVDSVKNEKGKYSWGQNAEKVYYSCGSKASPRINPLVKKFFDQSK